MEYLGNLVCEINATRSLREGSEGKKRRKNTFISKDEEAEERESEGRGCGSCTLIVGKAV